MIKKSLEKSSKESQASFEAALPNRKTLFLLLLLSYFTIFHISAEQSYLGFTSESRTSCTFSFNRPASDHSALMAPHLHDKIFFQVFSRYDSLGSINEKPYRLQEKRINRVKY